MFPDLLDIYGHLWHLALLSNVVNNSSSPQLNRGCPRFGNKISHALCSSYMSNCSTTNVIDYVEGNMVFGGTSVVEHYR